MRRKVVPAKWDEMGNGAIHCYFGNTVSVTVRPGDRWAGEEVSRWYLDCGTCGLKGVLLASPIQHEAACQAKAIVLCKLDRVMDELRVPTVFEESVR